MHTSCAIVLDKHSLTWIDVKENGDMFTYSKRQLLLPICTRWSQGHGGDISLNTMWVLIKFYLNVK